MLARIHSAATLGLESRVLDVEVDASHGLPRFTIVGLPDATVREARERVRSALRNGGFPLPAGAVTVNLAPADFRKCGAALDLPVAVGLLWLCGVRPAAPARRVFVGELGLDGQVRAIRGALCMPMIRDDNQDVVYGSERENQTLATITLQNYFRLYEKLSGMGPASAPRRAP